LPPRYPRRRMAGIPGEQTIMLPWDEVYKEPASFSFELI
jgi:hypothetical protein